MVFTRNKVETSAPGHRRGISKYELHGIAPCTFNKTMGGIVMDYIQKLSCGFLRSRKSITNTKFILHFVLRSSLILILLTYVIPCWSQKGDFPYQKSKQDIFLLPMGIAAFITSDYLGNKKDHNLSLNEIANLNRHDINKLDRNATYFWNRSADKFSNVVYRVMPILPLGLGLPQLKNKNWDNATTLGVMYIEVLLFTKGITGITKSLVGRTRPYLYNTSFTIEERFNFQGHEAPTASTSFFSGHSSGTFAFAVFLSKTCTDIYGKKLWTKLVWATSLSLASATAYSRVAAGEHFPTDVIVGAVVGSFIGYTIPVLHKLKPKNLILSVMPFYWNVSYKF